MLRPEEVLAAGLRDAQADVRGRPADLLDAEVGVALLPLPDGVLDPRADRKGSGPGEQHERHPGSSEVDKAAMKASCGTSTRPTIFIRFLPSFCFSSSLRLREMSPP